ncbi:MAG: acyltransferase [Ruminococcus flavefaciens]|nr:acyltransferase [Bacteroides sp.]MCM1233522.1 acyltransferase [Ruminococcus flavefaciens]
MIASNFNIIFLLSFVALIIFSSSLLIKSGVKTDGNIAFMGRDYTTALKGVAILLIMACHVSGNWMGGRLLTPWGGIGVSLFLIVSGYGLNESYRKNGLNHFWRKRIGRVYIPYAIVVLALLPIRGFQGWNNLLLQLFCVNSLYWFVPYIIECYIVFWLCSRFMPRYRMGIFLFVCLMSLLLAPEIQAEQALSFIAGVWMSEHKDWCRMQVSKRDRLWKLIIIFAVIGLAALCVKQLPVVRAYSGTLLYTVVQLLIKWPLGLVIVLGLGLIPSLIKNPFIVLAGVISYELYLVHFPFYGMVGTEFWPAIILWTVSFAISWLFHKLNDRIGNIIG